MAPSLDTISPLRVAIVGLGYAGERHLQCFTRLPDVSVRCLADVDRARLESIGAEYRVPRLVDDWAVAITADDVDAVSVCTPNQLHAPVAIRALECGKHVLCIKPLARTAPEAQAIVDAARGAGRLLEVAYSNRARSPLAHLKEKVAAGALGRIYDATASWLRADAAPAERSWYRDPVLVGGGPVIDLGVHLLDIGLYLLGEPHVTAVAAAAHPAPRGDGDRWGSAHAPLARSGPQVETFASALLRLETGDALRLEVGWHVHTRERDALTVTLHGTEGGARLTVVDYDWTDALTLFGTAHGAPTETIAQVPPCADDGHMAVIRGFVEKLRAGDVSFDADGAIHRATVIDACYESASRQREIRIPPRGSPAGQPLEPDQRGPG